jgi:hypothetical protein
MRYKVRYIGSIPNNTFNRSNIYTVIKTGITDCPCREPYVILEGKDNYTTCCHKHTTHHFNGAYFDAKNFRRIEMNNNIRVL